MKVAIIGAGISGILAIKACKEESSISEIVCFERTRFFGGIWKYRSGCWVLPRLGFRGGRPNDLTMLRRYLHLLKMYIPTIIQQIVIETMYNKRFDHELFGLRPNHPLFHEHPTCRWYVQTLIGNCELPSIKERLKAIEEETINRKRNFTQRFRHGTKVEWIPYLDELAEQINAKPNLKKLIIEDPKLWFKLMLGPSLPYQYRLQGPHAWSEARAAIFSVNQRVEKPFEIQYIKYEKQALYVPKMSEINVLLRITFGLFVLGIENCDTQAELY
ncbi:dimethylaniline monooxygenase [N-oxide-forming] 5-like protein [Dinothrombium tinctorium]|uniref:Flavin-containing monooxygenase n=1 Tax=Dinothrombium tinctorium TaxID=1965070 RepID=A0A3S3QLR4_9ACAR|nr:dimethylaniline monooxygenase [N-oxide-forming] 5-like protein [Dinothrombium tinctorium]